MKSKLLFLFGLLTLSFSVRSQTLSFTVSNDTIAQGDSITFTNTSTGFAGGQVFVWRFGDDCGTSYEYTTTGCERFTTGTGATIKNTYYNTGTFTARLMYQVSPGVFSGTGFNVTIKVEKALCKASAPACDLILNGSFETDLANGLPVDPLSNIQRACPWLSPTQSSPDLFAPGWSTANVPNNIFGSQNAQIGNRYAGLIACSFDNPNSCSPVYNWREYIQQEMVAPLKPGVTYEVKFYVSLAGRSGRATKLGAIFTDVPGFTSVVQSYTSNCGSGLANRGPIYNVTPQYETTGAITDTTGWQLVSFTYTAPTTANPLRYITIGYFNDQNNTGTTAVTGFGTGSWQKIAYYYIDNVSVKEVCATPPTNDYTVDTYANTFPTSSAIISSYGSTTIINKIFYVRDLLTVDANVTFTGCTFEMAPCARIVINPSRTMVVNPGAHNTYIRAACNHMWDGIYITDSTARLEFNGTSGPGWDVIMQNAENGILSQLGGQYFINRSLLQNNYKAMQVLPFNGNHTGVITGTKIIKNAALLPPYTTSSAYCGIEVTNVRRLRIGADYTVANSKNIFDNLFYGIIVNQTSTSGNVHRTTIVGNYFKDITGAVSLGQPAPRAIWIRGNNTTDDLLSVRVGLITDTVKFKNRFQNCRTGVYAENRAMCNTVGNIFEGAGSTNGTTGITYLNCTGADTLFAEFNRLNEMSSVNISYSQVHGARAKINSNLINTSGTVTSTSGILMSLNHTGFVAADITNNTVNRCVPTGIYLTDVFSSSASPSPYVYRNDVDQSYNITSVLRYGIRLENVDYGRVYENTVTRTGTAPTSSNPDRSRGISVANTDNMDIRSNGAKNYGTGYYFDGALGGSGTRKITCNTADANYHQMFFNSVSSLGTQGATNYATGNTYNAVVGPNDMAGSLALGINWYRVTGGTPFVNTFSNGIGLNLNVLTPGSNTNSCTYKYARLAGQAIDAEYVDFPTIDQSQTLADNYYLYYESYNTLRTIAQDSLLTDPTGAVDSAYNHVKDLVIDANSAIPQFYQIKQALDTGNVFAASVINSSIQSQYQPEQLLKDFYTIYLATWGAGNMQLSAADSATLYIIATADGLQGIDAVYGARAMLGLDPAANDAQEKTADTDNNTAANLYPNPAGNSLTIMRNFDVDATIEVYSINGACLLKQPIQAGTQNPIVDVSNLANGLYVVRAYTTTQPLFNQRLAIVK
jgi:hypothetical protein